MADQADQDAVKKAAAFIGKVMKRRDKTALTTALAIGEHIYREFLGGSPTALNERTKQSPSLVALMGHPKIRSLGIKHRTLVNYVNVAIQNEKFDHLIKRGFLPKKVKSLNYSQRVALRPAKTVRVLREAATRAVEEKMRRDDVKELVRELNAELGSSKSRAPRPPGERSVLMLRKTIQKLYDLDEKSLKSDDLGFFGMMLHKGAEDLEFLSLSAEAELSSRPKTPGATAPAVVVSADELDELLEGPGLGDGNLDDDDDRRSRALAIVRDLGSKLLANIQQADAQGLREWWSSFQEEAVKVVPELAGASVDATARGHSSSPGAKGRRAWYVVSTYVHVPPPSEVEVPLDWMESGYFHDDKRARCLVEAHGSSEAEDLFAQRGLPLMAGEDLRVESTALSVWLREKYKRKFTVKTYLERKPPARLPTLDEFVADGGPAANE